MTPVTTLHHQPGFTLIEAMVTVAILTIVLSIGVPAMTAMIENYRLTAVTNELLTSIQFARTEAIRQRNRVTICSRAANGDVCDNATGWSSGWLIYLDDAPAANPTANANGLLRIASNLNTNNLTISGSSHAASYLSFSGNGGSISWNGSPATITLTICSTSTALDSGNRAREILVNAVGRAYSSKVAGFGTNCTRQQAKQ